MTVVNPAHSCAWEESSRYRWLYDLDRTGLAWEFLRRNPAYRVEVGEVGRPPTVAADAVEIIPAGFPGAAAWGLSFRGRP